MEINILGRKICVRYVSDRELNQITKDTDCLGYFDNNTIFLSSSLSMEHSKRVLLHELAHAVMAITGLTNVIQNEQEEAICDAFESLLEVFRNEQISNFLKIPEE
jgi:Zn-dependent peptidase ImmA (M78 family)